MKIPNLTITVLTTQACLTGLLPHVSANSIQESYNEFKLMADLDADGREDIVVIDKSSGGLRAAYQLAEGIWTWYPARSTGMDNITGVATGHWFGTDKDALAITNPLSNRVHIVEAPVPGGIPGIKPVYLSGVGPSQLAGPDIGGGGNTVHDDLWTASRENSSPTPNRITITRHDGIDFSELDDASTTGVTSMARDVVLKEGGLRHVVYLAQQGGQDDQLNILSYEEGSATSVESIPVPQDSLWTSGMLVPGSLHHFITWRRGQSIIDIHAVTEDQVDVFGLQVIGSFDTGISINSLSIVQSDNGPRIVAIDDTGEAARIYSFDGNNPPQLIQTIDTDPGFSITGALPMSGNGFHLLNKTNGSDNTSTSVVYNPDGGTFAKGTSSNLPTLRRAAIRANTFAFETEPFVDPSAQLLGRYNVPDWTSEPFLQGNQLTVQSETLGNPQEGLGDPLVVVVGTVPMGTAFALTNQYNEAISLHSYSADIGTSGASVDINPVDGLKTKAFLMTFIPSPANAEVHYRLNEGEWIHWNNQAILISENTTVHYFARDQITQKPSNIEVANYIFEQEAHQLDSDGDGVPDFVEQAEGLDPLGGVDSDGDGYSDLNELLVGTDPNLFTDIPTPDQRLEENIAFRMRVAPLPVDGLSGNRATASEGARLDVFGLDASSLGGDSAVPLAEQGVTGPGLALDAVIADSRQGFVSVMTEPVYAVTTPENDKDRGREIGGLLEIPEGSIPEIQYSPGNGTQEEEAIDWINAALAARNSIVRPTISSNWTEIDTLSGLLLESELESIFLSRGLPGLLPEKLTLFGGRTGDVGRMAPTGNDISDLRIELSPELPGYDIRELFSTIDDAIQNDQELVGLRDIATAIFAVSSENSNAAPPGTYLPPFDVLRSFVRGNPLPEPYLSEIGIDQPTLDAAQAAIALILNGLPSRPVESFTLEVQPDSFDGTCHNLLILGTDQPVNLFAATGKPFASTDGFDLIPGTKLFITGYTDVVDDDCDGIDMEVISVVVLSFPIPEVVDADENLLNDAWEDAFLMGDGDPYGDADNDGINNLQEMLDGTDPLDPLSMAMEAMDLNPPEILVSIFQDTINLSWTFPAEYSQFFDWEVSRSSDFINWSPVANPVVENPAGTFNVEATINNSDIFRVQMLLK